MTPGPQTSRRCPTCGGIMAETDDYCSAECAPMDYPLPTIPADPNYPPDAVQCDGCGGNGCEVCERRGWLVAGHVNGRRCERAECGKPIPPAQWAVYCSNECAALDADLSICQRAFLSSRS